MKRVAILALVVTMAGCSEPMLRDRGLPEDGGKPSSFSVTGTVKGPGQASAILTLRGTDTQRTATSSASGGYQFMNVTAGDYTLTVAQKGFVYTPSTQTVKVASADVKAVDMDSAVEQTGSPVSGTVSGDAMAKVLLTLTRNGTVAGTTFSSEGGGYRLEGVVDGTFTLTPSLAGHSFTPTSRTVSVTGNAVSGQDFTSKAVPYAVSGAVSGDVKAGVALTLVGNGKSLAAATDALGVYSIADATDGTYTLTPSLVGYTFRPTSRPVTVAGKVITGQDFLAIGVLYTVGGAVGGDVKAGVALTLVGNGKTLHAASDANGVYSVANATAGTYTLTPSIAGYAFTPATRSVTVVGAAVTSQDFTSTAVPNAVSGAISGDVKAGVALTLVGKGKTLHATSDANGVFSVANATTGNYTLTPSLAGYTFTPASRTVTMIGEAVGGQDFTSTAVPYVVSGTVSGDVRAGVALTLVGNGRTLHAASDANGAFSVANATVGTYTLTPSLAGHTFTPATLTVTVAGANVTGRDFTSTALKYALAGSVTGEAPTGVLLTLSRSGATALTTLTASGGAFRIDGAVDGTHTLTPSLAGYTFTPAARTVIIAGAAVTAQDFTSKAVTYAVSGTVSGDVKAGVAFTLVGNGKSLSGTTDGTGVYSIAGATNGTYTLTPSLAGYTFTPATRTVIVAGAAVTAQDFTSMAVTYAVNGTVSGDVKAGVALTLVGNGKSLSGTTDGTGVYSIAGATAGTYTLTPTHTGYTFTPASRAVTVADAAVTGQDFTSKVFTGAVSGTVSGDVKAGVAFTLVGNGKSLSGITDGTGVYSIAGATNGTYTLTPTRAGYTFRPTSRTVTVADAAVSAQDFIGLALGWSARSPAGTNVKWKRIASSRDGKFLAAVVDGGHLYTSRDYGATWQDRSSGSIASNMKWGSITMSSDGKFLAAVVNGGHVYTSNDYGETWLNKSLEVFGMRLNWFDITMSGDGKLLAAVVFRDLVYTSVDFGETWESKDPEKSSAGSALKSISISSDGTRLTTVTSNVYTSSDFGDTWENRSTGAISASRVLESIAMSGDGQYQAIGSSGGPVYFSKDYGASWQAGSSSSPAGAYGSWLSIAMSSNGSRLAAAAYGFHIYSSDDFGVTWKEKTSGVAAGNMLWNSVTISDDGKHLAAAVYNGLVYTYVSP